MNRPLHAELLGDDAALRRCALTLHALGAHDRGWLLAKLPASQREELDRLLGELQLLGIPAEPQLARAALKGSLDRAVETAPVAPAQAGRSGGIDFLDPSQAGALAQVLQHEPAALIAHVVGLRGTTGEAVLEHLTAPKRRQVQELMSSGPRANTAPRLSEALAEELSARLAAGGARQVSASAGLVHSIATRWRSRWARSGGHAS